MIARSDTVQAIGNVRLVRSDGHRDDFEFGKLGPIARTFARLAIGEVALMHDDGDIMGFRSG
ncbi:MAG TPA: hypothetical protein VGS27_14025 [Candidatus Sulfotelmatobacter sp.]|nr:hypothetical protein [Candidatus Sulfotelmatobacter sp.]